RNFMWDLAVVPLVFADQLECSSRRGKVTLRMQCQRGPKRITSKKPGKTGPLALTGSSIARNKPGPEIWIGHDSLQHAHSRPIVGLLHLRIRKLQADGPRKIVPVVFRGFAQQHYVVVSQMLIRFLC